MSNEEEKKELQCEECTCIGWKVGFWLCFVCCIITFVVMLILFIKKRKFQEKVLPILKEKANKLAEKAQEKLQKGVNKMNEKFDKKIAYVQKQKELKDLSNEPTDSSTLGMKDIKPGKYIPLTNLEISEQLQDQIQNTEELKKEIESVNGLMKDAGENSQTGGFTSIQELGFY